MKLVSGFLQSSMAVNITDDGVVISVRSDHITIRMKRGTKVKYKTKANCYSIGDKCLVAFNLTTDRVAHVYPSGHVFNPVIDMEEEELATKEEIEVLERECSRGQSFEGWSMGDGEISCPQEMYPEYNPYPEVLERECSRVQSFEVVWGEEPQGIVPKSY